MSGSNDHDQSSDSSNNDEEEGEEEEEEENCGEDSDSDLGSCLCQENTGCLTTSLNCGGYRPFGTAATGACPGPCQCAEEEAWNSITPPRPNYQWFNNFVELRRQWSDHARTNCYRFDQSRKSKPLYKHPLPTQKCALPTNHTSIPTDSLAHSMNNPCHELETNSTCCNSGSHNNYNKHRNHNNGLIIHGHHNHKNGNSIHDLHNCHTDHVTHDQHNCHTGHVTHIQHNSHTDHVTHDHHNHKKNHDTHIHHGHKICHDDHDNHNKTPTSGHEKSLPSEQSHPRSVKTERKFSSGGCIQGGCLCQPMPRSCDCPRPVRIDARANPECICACPTSPECLCPPSERRFPPIKSTCPYAKLCRHTPRLPPGPKCHCTKCQPPLPVPCDPCTVSKCRVIKRKPCWVDKEVCDTGKTDQEVDKAEPEPAEHMGEVKIEASQVDDDPVDQVEEISVEPVSKEEPVDKVEVIKIDRSVGKIDFKEEKPEFSCKKVSYHDNVEVKEEIDDHEEIFNIHGDDKVEKSVAIGKEAIDVTGIVGKEVPGVTECADVENREENLTDGNSCPDRCGEGCLAKCRPVQAKKCPKYQKIDSVGSKCSRKLEKIENLKNDEKISKDEKNQESSDDNLLEKNSLGDDWTFVDVEHSKRPIKLLNTINRAKIKRKQRNCDCEPEFDYVIIKFIRKISTDSIIIINKIFKKSDDHLENLSIKSSNLSNYLDDHEIISTMDLMAEYFISLVAKMNPVIAVSILWVVFININNIESQKKIINKNSIEGCGECAYYRCPENSGKCLLGSVKDPCNCCNEGKCAKLEGETCWNSSIAKLPLINRNEGFCSNNYRCLLRDDLLDEDNPEAICVCMEQSPACGSNNITYVTPCALHEEAIRLKNKSLKLKHLGPCLSPPWIISPLENIFISYGQRLAINCEAKGFPIPDIFWEFHSADGRVIRLPNAEYDSTVNTREESELFMRTSWLQVGKITRQHIGTYQCIANNTLGDASTESTVSIL